MPASTELDAESWGHWPCALIRTDAGGLIVAVNDRFLNQTGYGRDDVVGRMQWIDLLSGGSRLLFETRLAPVLALDGAVDEVMVDLVAIDGHRLPALISAQAVMDVAGHPAGLQIALMTVPDRREYEQVLRQARASAEQATADSAKARSRLELLAAANFALASSVDVPVALGRLAKALVAQIADWSLIFAVDDAHPDAPEEWAVAHVDKSKQSMLQQLAQLIPIHATPSSAFTRVITDGAPVLLASVSAEHQALSTDDPAVLDLYAALDLSSAMVIPSIARGQRVAVMVVARGSNRAAFTAEDLVDLTELAAGTGIAIDNLRNHAREHSNSMALQQALLTPPPAIEPFEIVTRYLPATDRAEVGGDWYDAFAQPGGGVAIVIGDVVGHDIQAAAEMGQLRGIVRTIANAIAGTPADTLTRADRAADSLQVKTMASAIIAQIEPQPSDETGGRMLLWSNAGHPPPILVTTRGDIRVLERPADPLLGVRIGVDRHDHSADLHPGDTLLLYTDGLIERPDEDFDTGLARLVAALAGGNDRSIDQLCDEILAGLDGRHDDIAILALRIARD